MLFNSLVFLVFMAAFFAAWPILRRRKNSRWIYLVVASFVFYGWWDWRFLFLIVGSGLIDFCAGLAMARWPARRKAFLIASIFGNLGSLAVFKYLDFGIANVNWLLGLFGADGRIGAARLILPVGISFYTFQSMSYTIDIYRGQLAPTRNVFHFFAYLSMFPQLVAGPIVRAADLLPQLAENRTATDRQRWDGLRLIVYGFFKKVVVADNLAPYVVLAFGDKTVADPVQSCAYWWAIMLAFTYQIYCDFSGYSDIARGLGKWMGYEFPVNFNHPYIASSFRDFWSRWHISLSTWFRDYVYIPLGGSRRGVVRASGYMFITMVVSGLWHGAQWTYVIWGAIHGFLLLFERITKWPKRLRAVPVVGRHAATLIVFLLWVLAFPFFRAHTLGQAWKIFVILFDFSQWNFKLVTIPDEIFLVVYVMMGRQLWFHFGLESPKRWRRWGLRLMGRRDDFASLRRAGARSDRLLAAAVAAMPFILACIVVATVYLRGPGSEFIYFQF